MQPCLRRLLGENVANSHKSLDAVRDEVETFIRLRNVDGISIAGGNPLHPQFVEIVRMIAEKG